MFGRTRSRRCSRSGLPKRRGLLLGERERASESTSNVHEADRRQRRPSDSSAGPASVIHQAAAEADAAVFGPDQDLSRAASVADHRASRRHRRRARRSTPGPGPDRTPRRTRSARWHVGVELHIGVLASRTGCRASDDARGRLIADRFVFRYPLLRLHDSPSASRREYGTDSHCLRIAPRARILGIVELSLIAESQPAYPPGGPYRKSYDEEVPWLSDTKLNNLSSLIVCGLIDYTALNNGSSSRVKSRCAGVRHARAWLVDQTNTTMYSVAHIACHR